MPKHGDFSNNSGPSRAPSAKTKGPRRSFITIELRAALSSLSGSEVKVWLVFSSRANTDGLAWPGNVRVAQDTGLSLRTARTAKRKLVQLGLLVATEQSRVAGRFWTKRFRVIEPSPSILQSAGTRKGNSAETPTQRQYRGLTDVHFSAPTDGNFSTAYKVTPVIKNPQKHVEMNSSRTRKNVDRPSKRHAKQEKSDVLKTPRRPIHPTNKLQRASFRECFDYASRSFYALHGRRPTWDGSDGKALKRLLEHDVTIDEFQAAWDSYASRTDDFTLSQGTRLRYFCCNFDRFSVWEVMRPDTGSQRQSEEQKRNRNIVNPILRWMGIWVNRYGRVLTLTLLDAYFLGLRDLTESELEYACKMATEKCARFPVVAHIREFVRS